MDIKVRAHPSSNKELVMERAADVLEIWVKEEAKQNMANNRIKELVADHFRVRINQVRIISGQFSPNKTIEVKKI